MTPASRKNKGIFEWGMFAVLGGILVFLALPRLAAEYNRLQAAPTLLAISRRGEEISGTKIAMAAEKLENASSFANGNRTIFNALATADLAIYESFKSEGKGDEAYAALSRAQANLRKALKRAPGEANLWYLLAEARARSRGVDKKTVEYLRLSYLIGPREGWVAHRRLKFSLLLWPLLPKDTRAMVYREIRSLWSKHVYRRELARIYLQASESGQKAMLAGIEKMGENEKVRFLKLVNHA